LPATIASTKLNWNCSERKLMTHCRSYEMPSVFRVIFYRTKHGSRMDNIGALERKVGYRV
jgi:hypothetical protein